jgi:hypothetical protein
MSNKRNNNKANIKRRRNKRARPRGKKSNGVSQIKNQPIQTRVVRYIGPVTAPIILTTVELNALFVSTTNASTGAFDVFEAVRLRSVGMTILPDSGSSTSFFSFTWEGDRDNHVKEVTASLPGVLTKKTYYPPDGSLASYWVTSTLSTQNLFTLDMGDTATTVIVDLHVECVMTDGAGVARTLSSAATFTGIAAINWDTALVPADLSYVSLV